MTSPAHIAMIGIPAVSHVLPSLEVIRELVGRGHLVTYANDPAVGDLVESAGAEFVRCTSVLPVADNNWPDDPIAAMTLFLDNTVRALPQLRDAYDRDQADLYLYDIGAYAARALAETQGRPLQIGKYVDPSELGDTPANVEVHQRVPQRALLEQADAFVTHAGMGGCGEGLLAGVPMIAVPQAAEQFLNADRLVELGVARRIDTAEATAENLRKALRELVSDAEVGRRSDRLRADTRAEGGTRRAADLIESMLG
ncbi:nucleotide disphospho-sugar-binding domain-containing protein [Nocardia wallacei]|uniref:nucleotide disphospho-sugar-binding domain-containing protein n=1 Tax=Nocardia wallacei TaxID=480035 RepID=UPI002457215D|nr:nucleotide disphospho-sugar-binding domain-containing protein [Nocardia wallacei]